MTFLLLNANAPSSGIERSKKLICRVDFCICKPIKQRRFARVGVANNRYRRHRLMLPPLPHSGPVFLNAIDFSLQASNPLLNGSPLGL